MGTYKWGYKYQERAINIVTLLINHPTQNSHEPPSNHPGLPGLTPAALDAQPEGKIFFRRWAI